MSERLINVTRGNLIESVHKGIISVVKSTGEKIASVGDVGRVVFARSSMKPLQTIPVIETGASDYYHLKDVDLSLMCASHNGEHFHTEQVQEILNKIDLKIEHLQCGTHPPRNAGVYKKLLQNDEEVTAIYNNCSGKHSGMLATAVYMKENVDDYYDIQHPVQQRILQVISDLTDVAKDDIEIGIDGCGVPVHGVPLEKLALAFARMADTKGLSDERQKSIQKVTQAMMHAPEMVGGTNRFCTDLMHEMNGKLFGKVGAEAVYCVGIPEKGIGIAVKVDDGNSRAISAIVMEVLSQLDILTEGEKANLNSYHHPVLLNARKEEIGKLTPVFSIK